MSLFPNPGSKKDLSGKGRAPKPSVLAFPMLWLPQAFRPPHPLPLWLGGYEASRLAAAPQHARANLQGPGTHGSTVLRLRPFWACAELSQGYVVVPGPRWT